MALSEEAKRSLAGLWGGYDFYLIRDRHFATASDMVERFLEKYETRWKGSDQPIYVGFAKNPNEVRQLLEEWAEKRIALATNNDSVATIYANIMFKRLYFDDSSLNFGSVGNGWKKKTEIAEELDRYKPWSVAHAVASIGGSKELRHEMRHIITTHGSSAELVFFEGWWKLTKNEDRPMLFPQVWGNTSGKIWRVIGERAFPEFFSFGLVNVRSRTKIAIQVEPEQSALGAATRKKLAAKRNLASKEDWLTFQFTHNDVTNHLPQVLDSLKEYMDY